MNGQVDDQIKMGSWPSIERRFYTPFTVALRSGFSQKAEEDEDTERLENRSKNIELFRKAIREALVKTNASNRYSNCCISHRDGNSF